MFANYYRSAHSSMVFILQIFIPISILVL